MVQGVATGTIDSLQEGRDLIKQFQKVTAFIPAVIGCIRHFHNTDRFRAAERTGVVFLYCCIYVA